MKLFFHLCCLHFYSFSDSSVWLWVCLSTPATPPPLPLSLFSLPSAVSPLFSFSLCWSRFLNTESGPVGDFSPAAADVLRVWSSLVFYNNCQTHSALLCLSNSCKQYSSMKWFGTFFFWRGLLWWKTLDMVLREIRPVTYVSVDAAE